MAYTAPAPKPTPLKTPSFSKPGKPKPEPATTTKNGKTTVDKPTKGRWPGLRGAGVNVNPNKPGKAFDPGKAGAVAAAKSHANKDTGSGSGSGSGSTSTAYSALNPLTPAQIKQQAKTTISAAYKPSFGDLNSEQKQLAAINAKRAQDNTAYQNWASGQENAILAQGAASDANFTAAVGSANSALAGAAPASAALVAQADARQGNVSDNSTSTGLGAGGTVDQNTKNVSATNDINTVEDLSNVKNSGDLLRSDVVNANSRIGDNEAGQTATAQQQLTAIATQRSKLQLSKAGDIQTEIARLQGVEIQKAQSAQQLALAQQTLGANVANQQATAANNRLAIIAGNKKALLQYKEFNQTLAKDMWVTKFEQSQANVRAQIEANTQMSETQIRAALTHASFVQQVKVDGWAHAAQVWKQEHPNAGASAPHAGNPGGSPLTANEQNGDYTTIHNTVGTLNGLFSQYRGKGGDTQVYQALANGTPLQVGTKTLASGKTEPIMKTFPRVDPVLLNAAFSLSQWRAGKGGLSPQEIAKLRAIGLRNVTQHLS